VFAEEHRHRCADGQSQENVHAAPMMKHFEWLTGEPFMKHGGVASHDQHLATDVYINVLRNMSVDCDCLASAQRRRRHNLGILVPRHPGGGPGFIDMVYKLLKRNFTTQEALNLVRPSPTVLYGRDENGKRDYELVTV